MSAGGNTTVHGRFNSTPSSEFSIDFYVNGGCVARPQDYLEGKQYVGTASLTTDGGGDASIDVVLPGVTLEAGQTVTATATDANGNTSEFSQRIVVSTNPQSGNAGPYPITLTGFNFLPGATATVGGLPATNVVVTNYNTITLTTPNLPAGSLNDITVTNTDTSAGTLPNGWIVNFLDVPESQLFNECVNTRPQRDHRRRRRRQLRRRAEHAPPADGGLPAEGEVRHLLRATAVHGSGLSGRALLIELRALDQRARRAGHHRRLRQRQLLPRQSRQPPADGGLPVEDAARQAAIRRPPAPSPRSRTFRARIPSRPGSTSSSPATSRPVAAAATTVR